MFSFAGIAAAVENASLRFHQAHVLTANGTRAEIAGFPSAELQPTPSPAAAFALEFDAGGLRSPVSSAMFNPSFTRTAPPAETPAAAVDVYLVGGDAPRSLEEALTRGTFAGSSIVAFRAVRASVRINLADVLNRVRPSGRFTLVVVPVGVPGKTPPFALAAAPDAIAVFASAGDRRSEPAALMQPLWRGTETREEAVLFYTETRSGVAQTRLLHRPRKIERVFSYQTGKDYLEGKDWSAAPDGTLRALPGTSLPIGTGEELFPKVLPDGVKSRPTTDGRQLIVTETWSYPLTVMVNYQHEADWSGPVPAAAHRSLPRTLRKLQAREPVTMVFTGDSIASWGRGSATVQEPPYGPTWPELFVGALRERFGGPIIAKNRALGSTQLGWGAANADVVIAPERADLVVIAFGMNDQRKTTPARFRANLEAIIQKVRAANPAAEFILVSSMISSPAVADEQPLIEFRSEMQRLAGEGIAIADVTAVTQHLVRTKPFIDIAVNNFNHPNDYLLRWYAQVAAELLLGEASEK